MIQGEKISSSALLSLIQVNDEQANPHFHQMVEWLRKKISTADATWLENFALVLTGKNTLDDQSCIKIKQSWREGYVFELHTCFNTLNLPQLLMDEDSFLKGLEFCLSCHDYNIA